MGMVRTTPSKGKILRALVDWSRERDPHGGLGIEAAERVLIYNDWSLTKAMAYVSSHDYDPVPSDIAFIKDLYNEIAKLQIRVNSLESYLMDRDDFEDSEDEELNVSNGDDDS